MSRTKNAMRNIFFAIISKLITLIMSFISRTVFIYFLGNIYLGVNGLFSEILTLLSFTELGFGTALNFSLYEPIANKNYKKVQRLLYYYKKIYRIIAFIISGLGIALIPFLGYLVKGTSEITIWELRMYYSFFLLNTVVGYFMSYKTSLANAEQKNYLITNFEFVTNLIMVLLQIIVIIFTHNYLFYLLIHTVLLILSRVILSLFLNEKFPLLKSKTQEDLSKEEKKPILLEVKGLIMHQFASVAIHQTDNVIISSLTEKGIMAVGYISNYTMLINAVVGIVVMIFNSIVSGLGNLITSSTKENFRKVFEEINFVNFWIYGFCAIAFYSLIPPFIQLWLGKEYLIDDISFFLIILNTYLVGQSVIYNSARNAYGNFNSDKWISFIQALLNLVISIWGAKAFGVLGVYLGTIVSRVWFVLIRPYRTYEMMFKCSVKRYYKQFFKYIGSVLVAGSITKNMLNIIVFEINIYNFVLSMIIVMLVPNVLFWMFYHNTNEYKNFIKRIKENLFVKK